MTVTIIKQKEKQKLLNARTQTMVVDSGILLLLCLFFTCE